MCRLAQTLVVLLLSALTAACTTSAQTGDYNPYKKPYSLSPTTSSVKVLWQMAEETCPTEAVVRYGTSPDSLNQEVTTSDGWMVEGEGYMHVVTLTGLQPFTRYYFTVGDSRRRFADTCSTKTAPEPGTAFRIFTISDIHGNSCHNWSNMQDTICALHADLALMNGDFVSDNGADRRWNKYFFTPGAQFLEQVPIMSSVGNHETGVPMVFFLRLFPPVLPRPFRGLYQGPARRGVFPFHLR